MVKVIVTCGIPCSGKSTWACEEVKKNPNTIRINRDLLRIMMSNYVWSPENEKLVVSTRNQLMISALKSGRDVIIDDCNISRRNFDDICTIVRSINMDCMVMEKSFYIELDEAIARNKLREGFANVPDEVIKKMWNQSGKTQHKFYKPRIELISKKFSTNIDPLSQDQTLSKAVIFDNDGTISLIHSNRNPYDASTCDQDLPNTHVIEALRLYFNAGYKILFVSGREEKDREPTEKFYKMHFPEVSYELYMRPTGDKRKDVIIKEEIYHNHILGKYNVVGWFDDRLQVCQWVYDNGLPLFRVGDPSSNF